MPHPYPCYYFSICIISLRTLVLFLFQHSNPAVGEQCLWKSQASGGSVERVPRFARESRGGQAGAAGSTRAPPHLLVGLPKLFLFFLLEVFSYKFFSKKFTNFDLEFLSSKHFSFSNIFKNFFDNFITNVCHKLFGIFFAFQNFLVKFSFFSFFY